jgi:hypothetical protein
MKLRLAWSWLVKEDESEDRQAGASDPRKPLVNRDVVVPPEGIHLPLNRNVNLCKTSKRMLYPI